MSRHTAGQRRYEERLMEEKPPRTLRKSKDKVIAGVCGGIAEWLGWDKTVDRVG